MSLSHSPSIVTSGLILAYDMNNTKKSFIGPPLTNSQWNSGSEFAPWTVSGVNTDVTGTSEAGPISTSKTWKFVKDGTSSQWNGWESSYGAIWTGSAGDIWTTSYWYKTAAPAGHSNFSVGAFYLPDWSRAYSTTVLANRSTIIADNTWRFNYTVVQINEAYSNAIIVDGPAWGYSTSAGTLYINGLQWNKNSYASAVPAQGTRLNTQALLDLTNQNTITASSLTYASDGATFSFDGNANYMQTTTNCGITGSVTLSAWIKPSYTGQTGPHSTIIATDTDYPYGAKLMNYKNSARYGIWLGFGGTDNYEAFVATDINDNTDKMLTATWEQSTGVANIYLNGILQSSISTGKTIPVVLSTGKITLGTDYNSIGSANKNKFLGNIYSGSLYNRALSATEILQNFNALRGRYGI